MRRRSPESRSDFDAMTIALTDRPKCVTPPLAPRLLRLGLLRDYSDEGWPSMDLCADMLAEQLKAE